MVRQARVGIGLNICQLTFCSYRYFVRFLVKSSLGLFAFLLVEFLC